MTALTTPKERTRSGLAPYDLPVPEIVGVCGTAGAFAWEEYFAGRIRNAHTRKAYLHAVHLFLGWCQQHRLELHTITPGAVGQYFDLHSGSAPTKKLHMSAIRGFFDTLVQRHVVVLNPALSVRTERFSAAEGKTPEITPQQAGTLRDSIALERPIDYRDHALIGVLIYTAVRVGAVARLRIGDLIDDGQSLIIRFREKGGKQRPIPARISLQVDLRRYLLVTGLKHEARDAPLFRTAAKSGRLGSQPMSAIDICRMIKRRARQAGLSAEISPHSFRAGVATDLLSQGVSLDDVQFLLSHSDSRTTKLYDRRQRRVTRNIVERISS